MKRWMINESKRPAEHNKNPLFVFLCGKPRLCKLAAVSQCVCVCVFVCVCVCVCGGKVDSSKPSPTAMP